MTPLLATKVTVAEATKLTEAVLSATATVPRAGLRPKTRTRRAN